MKKQMTILGLFVILTGLSSAQAQVRVGVVIGPPVHQHVVQHCAPVQYVHPSHCDPHHGHGHGHGHGHSHHNKGHHGRGRGNGHGHSH